MDWKSHQTRPEGIITSRKGFSESVQMCGYPLQWGNTLEGDHKLAVVREARNR